MSETVAMIMIIIAVSTITLVFALYVGLFSRESLIGRIIEVGKHRQKNQRVLR